jgi:thiol-disulfide isomerase/thioredoxin
MLLNLLLWACDAPISSDTSKPKQEVVESPIHWTECSYNGGDHICDLTLSTADAKMDNLYSHYGEVIVIDVSAMWCGPCQEAAWNSNSIDVSSGGVKWITVLLENLDGEAPSVEDGQMWGDHFGIWYNEILLGSPDNRDPEGFNGFANTGWPYFLILDKDLMIRVVQQGWNKEEILQHIADLKSE